MNSMWETTNYYERYPESNRNIEDTRYRIIYSFQCDQIITALIH